MSGPLNALLTLFFLAAIPAILGGVALDTSGGAWRQFTARSLWRFGLSTTFILVSGISLGLGLAVNDPDQLSLFVTVPLATIISWAVLASLGLVVKAALRLREEDPLSAVRRFRPDVGAKISEQLAAARNDTEPRSKARDRRVLKRPKWWLREHPNRLRTTSPYANHEF